MSIPGFLRPIVDDEALTRRLGDAEARILIEWLVDCAESGASEPRIRERQIRALCRRARGISRFVGLWCYEAEYGAALQLANAERFQWPLPTEAIEPDILMQAIIDHETEYPQRMAA